MRNKIILLTLLFGLIVSTAKSQVIKGIEIETDPIYYFNKGYSIDIAIATQRMLFRVLPYQTDVPSIFQGSNKDYKQTLKGVSFDADFYFKNKTEGFFAGLIVSYSKDEITNERNNQLLKNDHVTAGFRFGYRWFPFYHSFHKNDNTREHGLFLTPFIAPLFNFTDNITFADGREFNYDKFSPFGGVHIGWKFNFKKLQNK